MGQDFGMNNWNHEQAVENVQWTSNPPVGTYNIQVHNYQSDHVNQFAECNTFTPCPAIPIFLRVIVNGVTTIFEFALDSNMHNAYESLDVFIKEDVYTFNYASSRRNQAPVLPYSGPAIDLNKRRD